MKCDEFVFNDVQVLYYKCHKINANRGGSYIDSPDSIKNNNKFHQEKRQKMFSTRCKNQIKS